MQTGKVIGCITDDKGKPVGSYNKDPILDSWAYEVPFPDGDVQQYALNIIAKLIYLEYDENGRRSQMMDSILEYRHSDDVLTKSESYESRINGQKKTMCITKR